MIKFFKVPMKQNVLFFHMKEYKKLERLPFNQSLISYLVSELQNFEDTNQGKSEDKKQGNQSKSIIFVMSHTLLVDLMNN